jgi:hypothetical protein
MASGAKRKTTMAKLNRERAVLEKRHKKAAKKEARKREAARGGSSEQAYAPEEQPYETTANASGLTPS